MITLYFIIIITIVSLHRVQKFVSCLLLTIVCFVIDVDMRSFEVKDVNKKLFTKAVYYYFVDAF